LLLDAPHQSLSVVETAAVDCDLRDDVDNSVDGGLLEVSESVGWLSKV